MCSTVGSYFCSRSIYAEVHAGIVLQGQIQPALRRNGVKNSLMREVCSFFMPCPPYRSRQWIGVFLIKADKRPALTGLKPRLIIAVEFVYFLYEHTVEQMQRYVLRAYPWSTLRNRCSGPQHGRRGLYGTSSPRRCRHWPWRPPACRVIKYALAAGAGRAGVAAGVAPYTFAQLALPEIKALLGGHALEASPPCRRPAGVSSPPSCAGISSS